jgi:hypothetical protein
LRKGGQMVAVGLFGGALPVPVPVPVPLPALAMREVSLRGSAVGNTAQIRELVQLVRDGRFKLPAVQVRPLADAEAALRELEAGRILGRVVLNTSEAAEWRAAVRSRRRRCLRRSVHCCRPFRPARAEDHGDQPMRSTW